MTRFVLDAPTLLHVVDSKLQVQPAHQAEGIVTHARLEALSA